jgi:hypothetical protein
MNRSITEKLVFAILPIAAIAIGYSQEEAQAQYAEVQYAPPPPAYVASYEPVYYNGYAHYLYRNRWLYRNHGAWRGYGHEPGFLNGRRGEWGHHWHRWR